MPDPSLSFALAVALLFLSGCGRPAPRPDVAPTSQPSSDDATAWMPIELHRKLVFVPGRLGGREISVLVDSRSTQTLVSSRLAEELGLITTGDTTLSGVGGAEAAAHLAEVRLELGGWTLVDGTAFAYDLDPVCALAGREFHAVLGDLAFSSFVVDLDTPALRMRLVEPAAHVHECEEGATLPLARVERQLQLEAALWDLPPTRFDIDSGSNGSLSIYPHYAQEHGLLDGLDPVSTTWGAGVGGGLVSDIGTLPEVRLGTLSLSEMPATFVRDGASHFTQSGASGNMGNAILSRFRTIFDLSRGELHLHPAPDWDRPFTRERAGLAIVLREDGAEVQHVSPGSPAALAGWQVGDVIRAVDGERVGPDYWDGIGQWTDGPAGTRVTLTMDSGEVRELVLADYY